MDTSPPCQPNILSISNVRLQSDPVFLFCGIWGVSEFPPRLQSWHDCYCIPGEFQIPMAVGDEDSSRVSKTISWEAPGQGENLHLNFCPGGLSFLHRQCGECHGFLGPRRNWWIRSKIAGQKFRCFCVEFIQSKLPRKKQQKQKTVSLQIVGVFQISDAQW